MGGRIDTAAGSFNRDVRGAGVGLLPELARRRQVVSAGVAACAGAAAAGPRGGTGVVTRYLPAPRLGPWPPEKKGERQAGRQYGAYVYTCALRLGLRLRLSCLVSLVLPSVWRGGSSAPLRPVCCLVCARAVRALCVCVCVRGPSQGRVLAGGAAPMGAHARVYP